MANIEDKSTETRSTWDVEKGWEPAVKAEQNPAMNSTWTIWENYIFDPSGPYAHVWSKIFLASCVIAVSIDPLFFYIPVVNKEKKCLGEHTEIKNLALVLRSLTDFAYVLNICFQLRLSCLKTKTSTENASVKSVPLITYLPIIDILAIIPIPQVVVLVLYSRMASSNSSTSRKFMNFFLLSQYVPRILRIYLSSKELMPGKTCTSPTILWAVGAFNFFLYMVAGHVVGAVWYFHSILRETACWHYACKKHSNVCNLAGTFYCGGRTPKLNATILNNVCAVNPPQAEVYDFGIFLEAIKTGILWTENFPQRFIHCFWWGLRNLSNYGQNLETSGDVWEVFFAILISILGLLLFLYLIGNVQAFMELATKKSEDKRQKIKRIELEIDAYLSDRGLENNKRFIMPFVRQTLKEDKAFDVKNLFSLLEQFIDNFGKQERKTLGKLLTEVLSHKGREKVSVEDEISLWISKNEIPTDIAKKISRFVHLKLQDANAIDVGNLLPILYDSLRKSLTEHLCLPIVAKVPELLQSIDENKTIWDFLKPIVYQEKCYIIRKGEPIDIILFITDGVALTFGKKDGSITNILQKGDYYGRELLTFEQNVTSNSELPNSSISVIAHTKVEAFALLAIDLKKILRAPLLSSLRPADSI